MGRTWTRRAAVAVAVAGGAALAVAAVAQLRPEGRDDVEAQLAACADGPAPTACLRDVYAAAAANGNVAATLSALQSLARTRELEDCHLEAHRLAHAVFRVVGDVRRTFLLGGPQCRMGYLHGAVEASASRARGGSLPPCHRFRTAVQRGACAHGFGHALMLESDHDIPDALAGCREAAWRGLAYLACEQGVMMQNSLRYAGGGRGFAAAAARGCAAVAASKRLVDACFDNVGVVAALTAGHDRARAAAECRLIAAGAARASCLGGVDGEIAEAKRRG